MSFWILIISMVMPVLNVYIMTIMFQSDYDKGFAALVVGGSPVISLLSLALLFPSFKKQRGQQLRKATGSWNCKLP